MARGAQLDCRFDQRKRDALKTRKAAAESLPFCDVLSGFVDALLCRADTHQADHRTAEIETLHHLNEARAFIGNASVGGHANGIEEKLPAADRARAQVLELGAADAWRIEIDIEGADAMRA